MKLIPGAFFPRHWLVKYYHARRKHWLSEKYKLNEVSFLVELGENCGLL